MALLATRASKNPADWSDRELLRCVLRNDARAWAELVRRYRPLIYRCITKVTLKYAPSLSSADLDEVGRVRAPAPCRPLARVAWFGGLVS